MDEAKVTYGESRSITPTDLRSKEMDLESGILGKFFGNHRNAPSNIAGAVLLVLLVPCVVLVFVQGSFPAGEYWKVVTPIITLILGYVFGKNA